MPPLVELVEPWNPPMESSPFASQRAWPAATSRPSDFSWDSNQVGDQPATPVMQPVPGQADGGGLNADDGVRPRAALDGDEDVPPTMPEHTDTELVAHAAVIQELTSGRLPQHG